MGYSKPEGAGPSRRSTPVRVAASYKFQSNLFDKYKEYYSQPRPPHCLAAVAEGMACSHVPDLADSRRSYRRPHRRPADGRLSNRHRLSAPQLPPLHALPAHFRRQQYRLSPRATEHYQSLQTLAPGLSGLLELAALQEIALSQTQRSGQWASLEVQGLQPSNSAVKRPPGTAAEAGAPPERRVPTPANSPPFRLKSKYAGSRSRHHLDAGGRATSRNQPKIRSKQYTACKTLGSFQFRRVASDVQYQGLTARF